MPVLALLMLALTLTPAEIWRAPANDEIYSSFDPNLMFASPGGAGQVHVTRDIIDMTASPTSHPSANLSTTLRQKLSASLDVKVIDESGAVEPFRIGLWSPWTGSGYFLVFGPAPSHSITANSITGGQPGSTLVGGQVSNSTALGQYSPGSSYHVTFVMDRAARIIRLAISGNGVDARATLDSHRYPDLFGTEQISLTGSAAAGPGSSHIALNNYRLTLPHERTWATKVDDPLAFTALIALIALGLVAIALGVIASRRMSRIRIHVGPWRLALGAAAVYLVGNALLFPLGGHPFDFADEKLYAYIVRTYGTVHLFYLPDVISLAKIWDGVPYVEAAFPYNTLVAYLFTGIGWLNSLLFAGGGTFSLDSASLGYLIKAVNVLFGLGDAALIYLIMRELKAGERWSRIGAALFLFNPAVWFSMSVWGQTHVISIFFVLAAVLLAERHRPMWAWLALSAALLTRPQMVVFGLLLGIVFLRKFSWRENASAISWTVIINFVAWAPLTIATSPSLPVDVLLNTLHVQEAGGNQSVLTTVSQDAYSVWPLVTYFAHGATGVMRAFTPSSSVIAGTLTYQRLSQILTLAALLVVSGALLRKRATIEPGGYLPLLALGVTSFLMLLTGVVATHFLLALPFLILCRPWMNGTAFWFVVIIWSVTTFVPMYGDMGASLNPQDYPLLAPERNAVTHAIVSLYSWDRFITTGVVANVCALVWLGWLALRGSNQARLLPSKVGSA